MYSGGISNLCFVVNTSVHGDCGTPSELTVRLPNGFWNGNLLYRVNVVQCNTMFETSSV